MGKSELLKGTTETLILHLLMERPMYGYELIQTARERSRGFFEWKEGALYPCLHRLESDGLIAGEWQVHNEGKPRRYYALTPAGREAVTERTGELKSFIQALNLLLAQA